MEKNVKKNRHIYVILNQFAVHLKLTQHCKSTNTSIKSSLFWGKKKKEKENPEKKKRSREVTKPTR